MTILTVNHADADDRIVYSLNVDDIQNVANQTLGRALTTEEINKLIDFIPERMPWFDVLSDSINEIVIGDRYE